MVNPMCDSIQARTGEGRDTTTLLTVARPNGSVKTVFRIGLGKTEETDTAPYMHVYTSKHVSVLFMPGITCAYLGGGSLYPSDEKGKH